MKSDIFPVVEPLQLVAHVFEQESIFLWIHLETTFQKSENKLNAAYRDHASLVHIYNVPSDLK
jgi:hypothetical protein